MIECSDQSDAFNRLDRGVVIDVFVRVSLVGIEVLTIDARIVFTSWISFILKTIRPHEVANHS